MGNDPSKNKDNPNAELEDLLHINPSSKLQSSPITNIPISSESYNSDKNSLWTSSPKIDFNNINPSPLIQQSQSIKTPTKEESKNIMNIFDKSPVFDNSLIMINGDSDKKSKKNDVNASALLRSSSKKRVKWDEKINAKDCQYKVVNKALDFVEEVLGYMQTEKQGIILTNTTITFSIEESSNNINTPENNQYYAMNRSIDIEKPTKSNLLNHFRRAISLENDILTKIPIEDMENLLGNRPKISMASTVSFGGNTTSSRLWFQSSLGKESEIIYEQINGGHIKVSPDVSCFNHETLSNPFKVIDDVDPRFINKNKNYSIFPNSPKQNPSYTINKTISPRSTTRNDNSLDIDNATVIKLDSSKILRKNVSPPKLAIAYQSSQSMTTTKTEAIQNEYFDKNISKSGKNEANTNSLPQIRSRPTSPTYRIGIIQPKPLETPANSSRDKQQILTNRLIGKSSVQNFGNSKDSKSPIETLMRKSPKNISTIKRLNNAGYLTKPSITSGKTFQFPSIGEKDNNKIPKNESHKIIKDDNKVDKRYYENHTDKKIQSSLLLQNKQIIDKDPTKLKNKSLSIHNDEIDIKNIKEESQIQQQQHNLITTAKFNTVPTTELIIGYDEKRRNTHTIRFEIDLSAYVKRNKLEMS